MIKNWSETASGPISDTDESNVDYEKFTVTYSKLPEHYAKRIESGIGMILSALWAMINFYIGFISQSDVYIYIIGRILVSLLIGCVEAVLIIGIKKAIAYISLKILNKYAKKKGIVKAIKKDDIVI